MITALAGQSAHHPGIAVTILAAFAVTAGYVLSVLARPWRACRTCRGARVIRTLTGRRVRPCPACRGTGQRRRLAATAIHRSWWSIHDEQHRRHTGRPAARPDDQP